MNQEEPAAPSHPKQFAALSGVYLRNAYTALQQDEVEKASEFFWGSLVAAIKGVAALNGLVLRSHRQIWEYIRGLSLQWEDQELWNAFRDANSLHSNFYESGLTKDIVLTYEPGIRNSVEKLISVIPREVLEE